MTESSVGEHTTALLPVCDLHKGCHRPHWPLDPLEGSFIANKGPSTVALLTLVLEENA